MPRTFVAIRFPADICEAIQRQVTGLKKAVAKSAVRWVALENIHLTL